MVDVILVRYCPRREDEEVFEQTLKAVVPWDEIGKILVWDNTNENIGLVAARNRLMAKSSARFLLLMDFDFTEIRVDLAAMVEKLERDRSVGIIMVPVVEKDRRSPVDPEREWQAPVEFLPCCFMLMRRAVLADVGGLNEDFFTAYADWDLVQRMRMMRYQVLQHNGSLVRHMGLSGDNPRKREMWAGDKKVYEGIYGREGEVRRMGEGESSG